MDECFSICVTGFHYRTEIPEVKSYFTIRYGPCSVTNIKTIMSSAEGGYHLAITLKFSTQKAAATALVQCDKEEILDSVVNVTFDEANKKPKKGIKTKQQQNMTETGSKTTAPASTATSAIMQLNQLQTSEVPSPREQIGAENVRIRTAQPVSETRIDTPIVRSKQQIQQRVKPVAPAAASGEEQLVESERDDHNPLANDSFEEQRFHSYTAQPHRHPGPSSQTSTGPSSTPTQKPRAKPSSSKQSVSRSHSRTRSRSYEKPKQMSSSKGSSRHRSSSKGKSRHRSSSKGRSRHRSSSKGRSRHSLSSEERSRHRSISKRRSHHSAGSTGRSRQRSNSEERSTTTSSSTSKDIDRNRPSAYNRERHRRSKSTSPFQQMTLDHRSGSKPIVQESQTAVTPNRGQVLDVTHMKNALLPTPAPGIPSLMGIRPRAFLRSSQCIQQQYYAPQQYVGRVHPQQQTYRYTSNFPQPQLDSYEQKLDWVKDIIFKR